jgi:hypothetical protein
MKDDRLVKNQGVIDQVKDKWVKIFNLLSYQGFNKKDQYEKFDSKFGSGNWLAAHFFDGAVISRYRMYLIYEEAYYEYLKNNDEVREWLISTASEVYDIDPSNVKSGFDYTKQECGATHLQDISIRRVLTRLKLEEQGAVYDPENIPTIPIFNGDHLVEIRGQESEGFVLNPGQVPFYKPELSLDTYNKSWWKMDSVEDIYQRNKVLLVNPDNLALRIGTIRREAAYFFDSNNSYYEFNPEEPDQLFHRNRKYIRRLNSVDKYKDCCVIRNSPRVVLDELRELCTKFMRKNSSFGKISLIYDEFVSMLRK